jgi:hypothetical protein
MPKKRGSKEDPVVQFGITLALLSFIFMIAYAISFNPLPFTVSIVGLITGLYLIAMRVSPQEAKALRRSLLKKLDFLFHWSMETGSKTVDTLKERIESRRKSEERETAKTELKMKCSECGHWNKFMVHKVFFEQPSSDPNVKVVIPMYEPLRVETCEKCKSVIAEPHELIRIVKK